MVQGCETDRFRALEETGEETPSWPEDPLDVHETAEDVIKGNVGEDGVGKGEVEDLIEGGEVEVSHGNEGWPFGQEAMTAQLHSAGIEQVAVLVHPIVVSGLQVADKMHADPKASTSYV